MSPACPGAGGPNLPCVDSLAILRYEMDLDIRPLDLPYHKLYGGEIEVVCAIILRNSGGSPCHEVPLILYRLLEVRDATDSEGRDVAFDQQIRNHPIPDFAPRSQVNLVTLHLPQPLPPRAEQVLTLRYGGPVCGRPESFPYVWDHVGWNYTLLRREVDWVPTLAYGDIRFPPFTYRINISVPSRLTAVAEGKLLGVDDLGDRTIYSYESERDHRYLMSVAAAPFVERRVSGDVAVFVLPEHAAGVDVAARALERTEELCAEWFQTSPRGPLKVVEVPEGYGSQSAPGLILQLAHSFEAEGNGDADAYREALMGLGHEAIHRWHPAPHEQDRTRWLDEGIAHYFQALMVREHFGEQDFAQLLEWYRERFLQGGEEALKTPIAQAGRSEAVDEISRGKGPWVLHVLHQWLGDAAFFGIMRSYFRKYEGARVRLADFVDAAKEASSVDLNRFFQEWFDGTESSRYLAEGLSVEEMVARYQ